MAEKKKMTKGEKDKDYQNLLKDLRAYQPPKEDERGPEEPMGKVGILRKIKMFKRKKP